MFPIETLDVQANIHQLLLEAVIAEDAEAGQESNIPGSSTGLKGLEEGEPSEGASEPEDGEVERKYDSVQPFGPKTKKQFENSKRNARRRRKIQMLGVSQYQFDLKLTKRHQVRSVAVNFNSADFPAAKGSYVGKRQAIGETADTVPSLLEKGFKIISWDGCNPLALIDENRRIVAVFFGRPSKDASYNDSCDAAAEVIEKQAEGSQWKNNRRGDYKFINCGISYGGGQKVPMNVANPACDRKIIQAFSENRHIQRIMKFSSRLFAASLAVYAPKLYAFISNAMEEIFRHDSKLTRLFPESVFPTATFNLGPQVVTAPHVDSSNLPHGLCSIWAGGKYDPKKEGYLVLYDFKILMEFPPGSSCFIPSGVLRHGNTPVEPLSKRFSITQYIPGGLVRWFSYGCQPANSLSPQDIQQINGTPEDQVKRGLSFWSIVDELIEDQKAYVAKVQVKKS